MSPSPRALHALRALPVLLIAACAGSACAGSDGDALDAGQCDLAVLVPGLDQVVAAPRADVIAEVLALECGDGIAAPPDLYAALHADLDAIAAVDPRMRLTGNGANVYPFVSDLAQPPTLLAAFDDVAPASAVRDPASCAFAMTAALHGAPVDLPAGSDPEVVVAFPERLHTGVLLHGYATLGIDFTAQSNGHGDGSHAAFRDVSGGREYLLALGAGDCPSGCRGTHSFWWRVVAGHAALLADWGINLDEGPYRYDDPPADFDPAGFACAKCPDGHATRTVVESACADGVDDDCDGLVDCADPDCAAATPCLPEVCDNGVDDNGDGRTDCSDAGCRSSLGCGATAACEAPADRSFLATFTAPGALAALDRQAEACSQRESAPACFADFFDINGVSDQCGTCLTAVGLCLVDHCPAIGHTDEEHTACVLTCGAPLADCLP